MALDQSFVGRTYPPTSAYEVGREKIREFADAIGDPDPAYRDPEAARALGDPDLGLDYSKVVHGEQRFVNSRPVYAGDRLTVVVTVESIRAGAGNDIITT